MLLDVGSGRWSLTTIVVILIFSRSLGAAMEYDWVAVHPVSLPAHMWSTGLNRKGFSDFVSLGYQTVNFHRGLKRPHIVTERPKSVRVNDSTRRRRTKIRKVSLSAGFALVGGVLAQWSKGRAENAFENYNRSANRQRQNREFARAEHFDRLAGTGFVIMELGVLLTAYVVFF